MALEKKDLESGEREPLIDNKSEKSMKMVIISTMVAVCGAFEFGVCCGYSSPTQSAIRNDIGLSLSEYSIFGSIMTIGAMIGAVSSGNVADFIGRKGAMRASSFFCIIGWLAIYFAKNALILDIGRFSLGIGIGVLSYVIFPINMKGIAGSLVVFANWFCSWVLCYAFNFLMSWSSSGTFLIFSAVCASTVLFVGKVVPETKSRTLEEIQASMNSYK